MAVKTLNDIKIECSKCNGTGKSLRTKCKLCGENSKGGVGKAPFYWNVIRLHEPWATVNNATQWMRDFAFYLGLDNIQELEDSYKTKGEKIDHKILLDKLQRYFINELRNNRRLTYSTQESALTYLKNCFERVDGLRGKIDWLVFKKDHLRHPSGLRKVKIIPYTYEQIKKLYNNSELQYKAIIALLTSSGIRLGGICERVPTRYIVEQKRQGIDKRRHHLKFKDLKPATEGLNYDQLQYIKNSIPNYQETFKITTYSDEIDAKTGEVQEYITYCSPEAHDLIIEWRDQRIRDGEVVTGESPVFRVLYNTKSIHNRGFTYYKNRKDKMTWEEAEGNRINKLKNPTLLRDKDIQFYIGFRRERYLGYAPIKGVRYGKARQDGPQLIHGFRAFHKTTMKAYGVEDQITKWLQGRDLKSVEAAYDKRGEILPQEILREYWKAVWHLTIDQTKYLELQIEENRMEMQKMRLDEGKYKQFEYNVLQSSNRAIDDNLKTRDEVADIKQDLHNLTKALQLTLTPEQMVSLTETKKALDAQKELSTSPKLPEKVIEMKRSVDDGKEE